MRHARTALEILIVPFLALLSGPARLLLIIAPLFLTLAAIGALAEFIHTGHWSDFVGIWECGALVVLIGFARASRGR